MLAASDVVYGKDFLSAANWSLNHDHSLGVSDGLNHADGPFEAIKFLPNNDLILFRFMKAVGKQDSTNGLWDIRFRLARALVCRIRQVCGLRGHSHILWQSAPVALQSCHYETQ